jgi:hypothetical protein
MDHQQPSPTTINTAHVQAVLPTPADVLWPAGMQFFVLAMPEPAGWQYPVKPEADSLIGNVFQHQGSDPKPALPLAAGAFKYA